MKGLDARHYLLRVSLRRDQVPSFDEFPFCLPAFRGLDALELHPAVTFLIGDNGTGKSTLMEAIAVAWGFNPEGGSTNFSFSTRASHSNLHERLRLARSIRRPRDGFFLRAESFFNLATEIERLDQIDCPEPSVISGFGGKSLHEQSHGESFLALLTHRLRGGGLYLLDEPEAALSPMRQMAALTRIHDLVGLDSQFLIATHSPILMAYPNATIYQLSENGIRRVQYTDTEYYTVTKAFLNKHEDMLRTLME
ncbi:MAG: AAA family ATPase [Planctomycetota bacterium]|nr:AAA family ATPase [Planctomycetota bacterium]